MVGIWLALGLISLASCAPQSTQATALHSPSSIGSSSATNPQSNVQFAANAPIDNAQSAALTSQLHSSQLPLVGARVLASNGGPRQAILYGFVRTPFGKADAADKARQWLNDPGAQIDNRIKVEPDLAGKPDRSQPMASNSDLDNPDLQTYQNQQKLDNQALNQQQQAYMNQGSPFSGGGLGGSGIFMMLPLLMGGFGGGGGSFGFGSGAFGSPYGSTYGSPYGGGYPSYPSPSYPSPGGSPYGP